MNQSIPEMLALLQQLEGVRVGEMNADELRDFRRHCVHKFSEATGYLHQHMLGPSAADSRWLWSAGEPIMDFDARWVSTFSLRDTDFMETVMNEGAYFRRVAAGFGLSVTADLFADGRRGADAGRWNWNAPAIVLSATAAHGTLRRVELFLEASGEHFPVECPGVRVSVIPAESCCESINDPHNIAHAYRRVAEAARKAGLLRWGEEGLTEQVMLEVNFSRDAAPEVMDTMFMLFGVLLRTPKGGA